MKKVALSFGSLQTGKYVARDDPFSSGAALTAFPFPSNGKVCSKEYESVNRLFQQNSFHSLQTGKYVARTARLTALFLTVCFHSLQTGKYVARRL